ncbi:DUF4856 domain-containing protein [Niastella caeni]|uniref:DUF4856 domain-containing protein n=1 Tax=Niastella caeni TaxID=2569763 RepID=A0A4S8H952_9BACT|nr:DUF4856 domain-containing protein [Niastella caeni]THU31115.1 DUF4856 domain-containing protein [Niastella caeni]
MNKRTLILTAVAFSLFATSCDKDDDIAPYTVPAAYNFDNVEFAEATATVNMWSGFQSYLGKSTSRQLSQDTVNYLWNNTNSAFTAEFISNLPNTAGQLNSSGFNLASKTSEPNVIKAMADSMVKVSQFYNTAGGEGIPGKQGSRLFNYSGFEFNQGVAKGLMGAMALARVIHHLDASVSADNSTLILGKGTAMQHEWDMAFGYVGIPTNYDTSKAYINTDVNRPLALGGYFAERGKYIKAGGIIFEAFRKGRAAIAAKDYAVRDAAIATIKEYLEKAIAAACYYYVTHPQAITDRPAQLHELSEGKGFVIALKFRAANSKLTTANYQTLVSILGIDQNAYPLIKDASFTKLKQVQQILTSAYGQLQP